MLQSSETRGTGNQGEGFNNCPLKILLWFIIFFFKKKYLEGTARYQNLLQRRRPKLQWMLSIILPSREMLDATASLLSLCWVVAKALCPKEVSVPDVDLGLRCTRTTCDSAITDCWQGNADTEQIYPRATLSSWVAVTSRAAPCCSPPCLGCPNTHRPYKQAPSLPSLQKPGSSIATSLFVYPEGKTKDIILYALVSNDSIISAGSCSIS